MINIRKDGVRSWLFNKKVGSGGRSAADIIFGLQKGQTGQNGVTSVNRILDNFATNADSKLVGSAVLEHIGFYKDEKGYTVIDGENIRVVTPHKLLSNIIRYEANNFKGKQKLIDALQENEDTRTDTFGPDVIFSAKTKQIANRTTTVMPTSSNKGIIVAPNDKGIPTLYVKVQTIGTSWSDGDHNGYWVETPVTYGSDYGITSQNTTILQGSEESEGKMFGNSQRKEAYVNQN